MTERQIALCALLALPDPPLDIWPGGVIVQTFDGAEDRVQRYRDLPRIWVEVTREEREEKSSYARVQTA